MHGLHSGQMPGGAAGLPGSQVHVTQEQDPLPGAPDDARRISPIAVTGLRLSTSMDLAVIAATTLDAVVPGFADAAVVFGTERLLRDGGQASPRPGHRGGPGKATLRRLLIRFADGEDDPGSFPPDDVVVFDGESPYARCVNDGKPVIFRRPDARTLERAGIPGRQALSRYTSFLAVPMNAGSLSAGLIALARLPGRPAFGDDDVADISALAASAGTGIANMVTLARHQSIAGALQLGLLAADPLPPAGIEVAGRCVPAAGQLVGGDWYDIIPLHGGRSGIIVGDVMGHGPRAAAVMGQLRAAARALGQLDLEPAELLRQLNRVIVTLRGMPLATCVYAVIDPAANACVLAAAGHLPPALSLPRDRTRILHLPAGQSLGIGPADYGEARIKLPPGAILALYTDGLVETRDRSYDQGIAALRSGLTRVQGPLDTACDTLVGTLAEFPEDDVTLILARVPGPAGPETSG